LVAEKIFKDRGQDLFLGKVEILKGTYKGQKPIRLVTIKMIVRIARI
jgi:hypothetical protein